MAKATYRDGFKIALCIFKNIQPNDLNIIYREARAYFFANRPACVGDEGNSLTIFHLTFRFLK
ncbi:MAG: hypothetical protein CBC09_09660 [Cellvibrionales bacterium TMED49]|nr:hypothetical protein [Porticoccaceae bacterium]OUU35029.1 MAG: hypothetical protein CBC09_09660 [Cellvibrionales bacterium TMED49]